MSIFPWLVWRCDCGQTARRAGLRLKHPDGNHSPLEGESARPGRSPTVEPVGGNETAPTPDKHWKEQSPDACMDVLEVV